MRRRPSTEETSKWILDVMGEPDFLFTLTFRPHSSACSKVSGSFEAKAALRWFHYKLNTLCFGRNHRTKGCELGFFAALEGATGTSHPHWHGAIKLPRGLSRSKFLRSFHKARKKTREFGKQFDLKPPNQLGPAGWIGYCMKSGSDCLDPEFLRHAHS